MTGTDKEVRRDKRDLENFITNVNYICQFLCGLEAQCLYWTKGPISTSAPSRFFALSSDLSSALAVLTDFPRLLPQTRHQKATVLSRKAQRSSWAGHHTPSSGHFALRQLSCCPWASFTLLRAALLRPKTRRTASASSWFSGIRIYPAEERWKS